MTPEAIQGWLAVVGGVLAALLGIFKYFNYRSKRDLRAAVGASFASTVDALSSDNETSRMAGAVLLRRFFDRRTEQGAAGTPYVTEAIELIAGMLREEQPPRIQKVLADGLRYAIDLRRADLQNCDLRNAYIGMKRGDRRGVDLSAADLFESDCAGASFRKVVALKTVFYRARLEGAVLTDADCRDADFREAKLMGAMFDGAQIEGARFAGAEGIPVEVANLLDEHKVGRPGAVVPSAGSQ
ncbi:pentapeptide repeat-containing protein [Rhodococcus daqingensis]|uniref:Pentapeptide repeat-containing protein n=1 Tax=Rhodococcus daqingensis TaxID=2479363 RepID=A0ABW2RU50_9NOCA